MKNFILLTLFLFSFAACQPDEDTLVEPQALVVTSDPMDLESAEYKLYLNYNYTGADMNIKMLNGSFNDQDIIFTYDHAEADGDFLALNITDGDWLRITVAGDSDYEGHLMYRIWHFDLITNDSTLVEVNDYASLGMFHVNYE
tara:strand:+ start:3890 stop:4318 length:429 start_codon:yes stop_codon:yes gene_type:complete